MSGIQQRYQHDFSDECGINYQDVVLYTDHLAALAEREEAVRQLQDALHVRDTQIATLQAELRDTRHTAKVYKAAIKDMESEIDALKAENERLKKVPMKYRRMEYNAQLQARLDALIKSTENCVYCYRAAKQAKEAGDE